MALGTPVYVILPTYGALFLLVLPALRWPTGGLLARGGLCALLSPRRRADRDRAALRRTPACSAVQLGLVYPVVTFLAYVLVGLAVARSGLGPRHRFPDDAPAASGPCRWGEGGARRSRSSRPAHWSPPPPTSSARRSPRSRSTPATRSPGCRTSARGLDRRTGPRAAVPVAARPLVVGRRRRGDGRGGGRRDRALHAARVRRPRADRPSASRSRWPRSGRCR